MIRAATADDTPAIARVHVDSWRTTYRGIVPEHYLEALSYEERQRLWNRALGDPSSTTRVFVAEAERDGIVGFASVGPTSEEPGEYKATVHAIYVLQEHQRKGLGRGLLGAVAAHLLQSGTRSMMLWVFVANPARSFYEAMGGKPIAEKDADFGGTLIKEVAYGWDDISHLVAELGAR